MKTQVMFSSKTPGWSTPQELFDALDKIHHFDLDPAANAPLTLEELRKMDGEPVWVQPPGIPECGSWRIVTGVDTEDGEQTLYCNGDYTCRDYGAVWLAYRRKPEEGMT